MTANTKLAEGVGFEPTLRLPVNTLSKRAPSTARPPLRRNRLAGGTGERARRLTEGHAGRNGGPPPGPPRKFVAPQPADPQSPPAHRTFVQQPCRPGAHHPAAGPFGPSCT